MADDPETLEKKEATPAELAKEVQNRAKKLCQFMNKKFDAERKTAVKGAQDTLKAVLKKKAKDGKIDEKDFKKKCDFLESNLPVFHMTLNKMTVSAAKRSGKDQAWYAIKNWSKTCRSAHLHHAAIHVNISVKRGSERKDVGLKEEAVYFPGAFKPSIHVYKASWGIMSYATFKKHWAAGLAASYLADCTGVSQRYRPADPWHVELPSEKAKGVPKDQKMGTPRPGVADKVVVACIDHYAEYAASVDAISDEKERKKHKKNKAIEKNYKKTFKSKYKAHQKLLEKKKAAAKSDPAKKKKLEKDLADKVGKMKGRMDKEYKELVEIEKTSSPKLLRAL